MPTRTWTHDCRPGDASTWWSDSPVCPHCGGTATYLHVKLDGMDRMAREQYAWGLKALGDHIPLTREILDPLRITCAVCHGGAWRTNGDVHPIMTVCPCCEGTGRVWTVPPDVADAAIAKVVAAFPDAVTDIVPHFNSGDPVVLHDDGTIEGPWRPRRRSPKKGK
ncbi:MAG: hypothetical protein WBC97_11980 [Gemmatimonadales bacterium]